MLISDSKVQGASLEMFKRMVTAENIFEAGQGSKDVFLKAYSREAEADSEWYRVVRKESLG